MRRKKSFRSTSFKFTEMGSPVYLGPLTAWVGCDFCSAAKFTAGSMAVTAGVAVGAGAEAGADASCGGMAAFAAGNRFPSGLSTNREAASTTRTGGATGAASFFAYEGSTTTKSWAAGLLAWAVGADGVVKAAVTTGATVFAGATGALATNEPESSFSVIFSPGPGTSSYLSGRSRSTTTRVVALVSVPIRTPVTPLLPT